MINGYSWGLVGSPLTVMTPVRRTRSTESARCSKGHLCQLWDSSWAWTKWNRHRWAMNVRWGATWRNFTFFFRVNAGQIVYCRFTSPRFCIMDSKLAVHECRIQDSSHEFEETSRWFSLYLVNIVTVCYSYIMRIHSILIHFVLVGMIWYDVWYIYT